MKKLTTGLTINGKTYYNQEEAVKALYDLKYMSIDNIAKTVKLSIDEVNKILGIEEPNVTLTVGIKQEEKPFPGEIKAEEKIDGVKNNDPAKLFEELETYVKLVGDGLSTALLITGQGGVGKSYTVKHTLKTKCGLVEGKDFIIFKGGISPVGLYLYLYQHYNKIIVFDDSDSVFSNIDSLDMLKDALDTNPERKIHWQNADAFPSDGMTHEEIEIEWNKKTNIKKHPSAFTFTGGIIFISNLSREYIAKKDEALLTRCNIMDISLTPTGIIQRMAMVLDSVRIYATKQENGRPIDITNESIKKEVFNYLKSDEFLKDSRVEGHTLSFRLLNKVYIFRYAGEPNWKELAFRAV